MDTIETMQEYETSRNQGQKDKLLQAMLKDDSQFVKRLGQPYTGHTRSLARQGVIKLPKGF